ncbi:glycosyltransferase family 2 protein [Polaribacter sp. Z014]|uniref:glycosyltransferase n=1 Tax=unclassified Polaribacter TaxID=196858 RepID=UPI00193C2B46|nr:MULTISPECIES: glycosyltransferase family 2 protein [unclassified Polaribacter]MCL7761845.1 glycosyltransferase family 2 protein [Polaribacter sp. Z014]QVY64757.1 glycosyltransferase family 2 protein [Polaribacter sp. Q13]
MKEKLDITVSIVLYNENLEELTNTINCFLSIPLKKKLYLIDNTKEKLFQDIFKQKEIEYIAVGKNIGFGAGHNVIISKIKEKSNFHLVLNPDVSFKSIVILNLISELQRNEDTAMIAPKVLFPNGDHQYSCRRFPLVLELLVRRFSFLQPLLKSNKFKGQYNDKGLDNPFFVEWVTGCFHLYKTADFIEIEGFDERYFLYMEDVDICKKIDLIGKRKIYYPNEEIIHVLKKGSSKNMKLFLHHSASAIKYFFKWGI